MAYKDPFNAKSLLYRQIELNWINAPLDDPNDYLALYLDGEPGVTQSLPISVHKFDSQISGQITTDYYLPQLDLANQTAVINLSGQQELHFHQRQPHDLLERDNIGPRVSPENIYNKFTYENQHNHYQRPQRASRRSISGGDAAEFQTGNNLGESSISTASSNGRSTLVDECVGYCVAYHSRGRILAKNCLKTNPNWMQDSYQYINSRSLPSLMLPGSHNSGTYSRQLDKTVLQMINKYQMNQDESIYNQLVFGLRHLDLRVGYTKVKSRPERLWIYHDIFRTDVSLNDVLEQVKLFLDLTSHEIVIMDFHRFTVGFQNENLAVQRERHAKMIDLIFKQVGHYIVPSYLGLHAPIQEYIAMGKRLIIGYASRSSLLGSNGLGGSPTSGLGVSYLGMLRSADSQKNKQVRDIDAINQDYEESVGIVQLPVLINETANSNVVTQEDAVISNGYDEEEQQSDRRMGTRIYNKLKSLKLVSNSFSKPRSPPPQAPPVGQSIVAHKLSLLGALDTQMDQDYSESQVNEQQDIDSTLAKVNLFFPPVRHLWPNKDTLEGLAKYMNDTTCRKYFGELRSLMVELTPTVFGAISDKYDGNRKLAQQVNRHVTDWIRDRWLHCVNIVSSDFFLGNDLIRLSIYANKMRLLHRNVDLNYFGGSCRSFRHVEHLLDRSKIPIQLATYRSHEYSESSSDVIIHYAPNGARFYLKPLTQSAQTTGGQLHPSGHIGSSSGQREKRDSFVENVSDGVSEIFSSFKRLFNI